MRYERTQIGNLPFGRYRLVERLGQGGMAAVFRAFVDGPEGFQRSVVIKRVLPELSQSPSFVRMLVQEARVSALLHHPGIVQVYELGQVGEEYYLAMEHIDGIDLLSLLRHCHQHARPIPLGVVLFVVSELAAALGYAHDLRDSDGRPYDIVHRDVNPSNVMITKRGAVKLLDFGIAKAADHLRDERTRTGIIKGKLRYLAPEQAEGWVIDRRADLFALGIVLHELLTLQRLFSGENDFKILKMVREAEIQPPSLQRPEVDIELDAIIMRMLQKRPEARYQSGEEIVTALAPHLHKHQGDAGALRQFVTALGPVARRHESSSDASAAQSSHEPAEDPEPTRSLDSGSVSLELPLQGPAAWLSHVEPLTLAGGIAVLVVAVGLVVHALRGAPTHATGPTPVTGPVAGVAGGAPPTASNGPAARPKPPPPTASTAPAAAVGSAGPVAKPAVAKPAVAKPAVAKPARHKPAAARGEGDAAIKNPFE